MSVRIITRFTNVVLWAALLTGCSLSSDLFKGNPVADIHITPSNLTLPMGQERDYTAEGAMSDGTFQDISKKTTWASSNASVATFFKLDGQSTLLTVGAGTTTITATLGSIQGEATLIVISSALKTLQINSPRSTIEVGMDQSLTATGLLSNGQKEDLTSGVVWASSDPSVATIDDTGFLTAVAPGTVTISVVAGEMRSTTKMTVPTPELTQLKITPLKSSIAAGKTQQFVVEGFFSNNTTMLLTSNVAWSSSDPEVLSINADGLATAIAKELKQPQVILVTALSGKITRSVVLTVTPPTLERVEVTPAAATVAAGRTVLFSAKGIFTDGTTVPLTSDVLWGSSEPALATITNDGLAKVSAAGNVTITAVFKKQIGTASLTAIPPDLMEIRVSPAIPFIASGRAQQFSAEGFFSDGTVRDLKEGVKWTSSNNAIAEISQQGQATAVAKGVTAPLPVRMTAAIGKISGTAKLTVTPPELEKIQVIPVIPFVVAGKTQQFIAQGTFTDGTDQPLTGVTWSASDTTAIAIDRETGLATTKSAKIVTITAALSALTGTAKLTVTPPELSTIRISPDHPIAKGLAVSFTAEGLYTDGTLRQLTPDVKWKSSDPDVLAFNRGSNVATALSEGAVTLQAYYEKTVGTAALTVTPPALTAIRISPTLPIIAGQTLSFVAEGTFTDGALLPITSDVTWNASNPSVLRLDANSGMATALLKGEVILTATWGEVTQTAALTVLAPELTAIQITPAESTIAAGMTLPLTAEGSFTNGTKQPLISNLSFSSSNTSIVKIQKDSGMAEALKQGEAIITAISGKISAKAKMTVTPAELNEIRVTPDQSIITARQTQKFFAEGVYTDKTTQSLTDNLTWRVSDPSVVTINQEGIANAKGVEEAHIVTITALSGNMSGTAKLTVTPPQLTGLSVTPVSPIILAGQSQVFTAVGTFTDGTTRPLTDALKWISSEPSILAIDNDGLAKAISKGAEISQTVTITAASFKIQGTTQLTITPAEITEIRLGLNETSVAAGRTTRFVVEGLFTDGTTRKLPVGSSASSSNPSVATIDRVSGLIKTLTPGNVTLTIVAGKIVGAANLLVTPKALTEIRLKTVTPSIAAGRNAALTAEGSFTDGTIEPLRSGLIFTSSDPSVLSIDKDGFGTAISAGDVVVTAASENIVGAAKLTVTPAELISLRMSPNEASIVAGRTQQFSLEGLFSDGTMRSLTSDAAWSSLKPAVAKIDPTGFVTALTPGVITITAVLGKIQGIAPLTVTPPELTGIRITPQNFSAVSGKTQQFVLIGFFTDNIDRPLKTDVVWKSSDASVATINGDGLLTTAGRGVDIPLTVRILGVYGKWTSATNLTVMPANNP